MNGTVKRGGDGCPQFYLSYLNMQVKVNRQGHVNLYLCTLDGISVIMEGDKKLVLD